MQAQLSATHLEISSTAAINPDRIASESPAMAPTTRRLASLVDKPHAAASIGIAEVSTAIIGRTRNEIAPAARRAGRAWPTDDKVSTATAIDPNSPPVVTPSGVLGARGPAPNAAERDSTASIGNAEIAAAMH